MVESVLTLHSCRCPQVGSRKRPRLAFRWSTSSSWGRFCPWRRPTSTGRWHRPCVGATAPKRGSPGGLGWTRPPRNRPWTRKSQGRSGNKWKDYQFFYKRFRCQKYVKLRFYDDNSSVSGLKPTEEKSNAVSYTKSLEFFDAFLPV